MRFWIILNSPQMAVYCTENGVDRIFLDLEKLGKEERQGHLDTWKSNHKKEEIPILRKVLPKGKLMVRLNPWNKESPNEINFAVKNNADFLILPMIKSFDEINSFCIEVKNRVPIIPLIETPESLELIPRIIKLEGVKEIYIGLNDLSLSLGQNFIFQPLANNMLERPSEILNYEQIPWGFGGIARSKEGLLPPELLLGEHVRLGSNRLILSRTFHRNATKIEELTTNMDFKNEIKKLFKIEDAWSKKSEKDLEKNRENVKTLISKICK